MVHELRRGGASGAPVTQIVTTNQLGWETKRSVDPGYGLATSSVDVNGKRTDVSMDGLGRTIAVWLPGQDKAGNQGATQTFNYLLRTNGANAVTTNRLGPNGTYLTNVSLYDGLLRLRQAQTPDASVADARLVADTFYDSAGRAWKNTSPYPMTGVPATDVYVPLPPDYSGPEAVPAWTVSLFDGAGRTTASVQYARNVEKWRTTTAYTGDRTDVTPPAGGTATSTVTDAAGNTVSRRHYHGPAPVGTYDTTAYAYNAKNQMTSMTDPVGNHWDYQYDLRGRQIQVDDPDKGRTSKTYDDAGRVLTTTDARNIALAHTYDTLGRPRTIRDTSATGTVRAEWTYDTVAKGQLTSSSRYVGGYAYTQEVQSYSARYSPGIVKYTLPATETGFGGQTFSFSNTYYADGSPATVRMPAAGGLAMETLTYGYDAKGLPSTLNTNLGGTLVTATGYTNYGEATVITLRNNSGKIAQLGYYYEDGTRRLQEIKTTSAAEPTTTYADVAYSYDAAGNITKVADSVSNDNQCFSHDYLRRLTEAWTPSSGNCQAAPTLAGLGGPGKYWQSWDIDTVGNRRTQVDHAAVDTTSTYHYPAPGSPRPHGVTSVALAGATTRTDSYTYDPIGDVATRPGGAAGQALTWDAEGHLDSVEDSTGKTSYIYDADGNRLIRKDPTGKTLYLPGQEIRYTAATSAATCTRYYTNGGKTVASRTPSGLTWLSSDQQATQLIAINAVTQSTTVRRQTPYGAPRGTTVTWPNQKGFVGGTPDATGLTHLGAREYDPSTGRFISDDPITDATDPQQINGYSYANNSPTTYSDADGLRPCDAGDDCVHMNTYKTYGVQRPDPAEQVGLTCKAPGKQCKPNANEQAYVDKLQSKLTQELLAANPASMKICSNPQMDCAGKGFGPAQTVWCLKYGLEMCANTWFAQEMSGPGADVLYLEYGFKGGQSNAYRHALWISTMIAVYDIPAEAALMFGVAHEMDGLAKENAWGTDESKIDLHNNHVGADIAKNVQQRVKSGEISKSEVQSVLMTQVLTLVKASDSCSVCLNTQGT